MPQRLPPTPAMPVCSCCHNGHSATASGVHHPPTKVAFAAVGEVNGLPSSNIGCEWSLCFGTFFVCCFLGGEGGRGGGWVEAQESKDASHESAILNQKCEE